MSCKGKELKTQCDIVHVMKFKTESANSHMTCKSHFFSSLDVLRIQTAGWSPEHWVWALIGRLRLPLIEFRKLTVALSCPETKLNAWIIIHLLKLDANRHWIQSQSLFAHG